MRNPHHESRPSDSADLHQAAPNETLNDLGVRLFLAGQLDESLHALTSARQMAPHDVTILHHLAIVLDRLNRSAESISMLEQAHALSPPTADSFILLGNLRKALGHLPAAIADYRSALALNPNSPIAWQSLGLAYQLQQEFSLAIDSLLNCLRLQWVTAPVLAVLGQLFFCTGQFAKSLDAYTAALQSEPTNSIYRRMMQEMRFVCAMINALPIDTAINNFLIDHAAVDSNSLHLEQTLDSLLHKSYSLLSSYDHTAAAHTVARKWVMLFPTSPSANYFSGIARNQGAPDRSPDALIVEMFDKIADRFDDHLTQTLGYHIPAILSEMLISQFPPHTKLTLLDAGCGTGLCAPHLRPVAKSLIGVDLSPNMLQRAQQQPYDALICSELTAYLEQLQVPFDAIIAADVLIYFGILQPLAGSFADALTSTGLLALSTERTLHPQPQLLPTGRFAHSVAYIQNAFGAHFEQLCHRETTLRIEANRPVQGDLYVFRKRPT